MTNHRRDWLISHTNPLYVDLVRSGNETAITVLEQSLADAWPSARAKSLRAGKAYRPGGALHIATRILANVHDDAAIVYQRALQQLAHARELVAIDQAAEKSAESGEPGGFHEHLDSCSQCRDHPLALCEEGFRRLKAGKP